MIDPLDDPELEARRLQIRSRLVDIARWLPRFSKVLPDYPRPKILSDYLPIGACLVIGASLIAYLRFDLIGGMSGLWIGDILNALLIYIILKLISWVSERNQRKDQ